MSRPPDDDTHESVMPEFAQEHLDEIDGEAPTRAQDAAPGRAPINPRVTQPMYPAPSMPPVPPPPRLPRAPLGVSIPPPPTSYSSMPSSAPPSRSSTPALTPPPLPRTSSLPPASSSAPPPLTNPRDNFRRIERLRNELRGVRAIQGKHERDVMALKASLEHLEKRLAAERSLRTDDNVDGRLALLGARVARLETQTGVVPSDVLLGKLATLEERLGAMEAKLEALAAKAASAAQSFAAASPAPAALAADDLTLLRGVGPKYQKALARAGVRTFAAVAAWTDADIERFAALLGTTPARVKKADWVGQAQKLAAGG